MRQTDSVRPGSRVRHIDELSDEAQRQFYELVQSGTRSVTTESGSFVDGEIIVFTAYYRVEYS
ncbi:hypothetical protein OB955_18430 [Halobacteria archaeon AArc-m2/3/4]|uniref:DUF7979 domain-containing protein n=1 Tax=Natronoglomus mannanivorans TaxID=2979990 RepID=A0ABT2QIE8_9EURY|nr:hypothetical protein [Halobacteria archaeon AArc-m2/3/4]